MVDRKHIYGDDWDGLWHSFNHISHMFFSLPVTWPYFARKNIPSRGDDVTMNTPGEFVLVHILRRPQGTMKHMTLVTQLWPLKQLVTLARKNESQPGGKKTYGTKWYLTLKRRWVGATHNHTWELKHESVPRWTLVIDLWFWFLHGNLKHSCKPIPSTHSNKEW